MLAVCNILGANFDLWQVNEDDSYHEEVRSDETDSYDEDLAHLNATQPRVPRHVKKPALSPAP